MNSVAQPRQHLDQYAQEPHTIKGKGITMSRHEAEAFMQALGESLHACTSGIIAARRKRSWRDSERAMTIASLTQRSEYLTALRARIGTAFNLGGW